MHRNARAAASRKNGAKSRGPKTPEGKARAAQNALKHGMRAQKYVLLPQEDAAAFAALETAILAELAPDGVLQTLLARRVAVAAWRLERADRMEAEVLEFRSYEDANAGLALIRDGNATRSFDTLMRYRSAAMAEFWRALKTLKALQAEQAQAAGAQALEMRAAAAPRASAGRVRSCAERTRAPAAARVRHPRPGRARPHPPRARSALDAERTRARSGSARSSGGVPDAPIVQMNGTEHLRRSLASSPSPAGGVVDADDDDGQVRRAEDSGRAELPLRPNRASGAGRAAIRCPA